ncbi:MAG: TolC family protein [Bdellovibrionaceae bacterium]|nr:TolC family protein [Pseudobdellovibrionaceae bacterium]
MKCFLILVPLFVYTSGALAKDNYAPLTLAAVERQALDSSFNAKTINAELEAAQNRAEAQHSLLYPKLTLEGTYKYITEVPTLKFPGGATTPFGDHQNYSIGPTITWNLLDFGSTRKLVGGAEALKASKEAEKDLINRQILLAARLAYFKIQLRAEQQRLVTDSLKLAESQHRDIQNRKNIGSSNRIDLLAAHKEVLNLKLQSRQLQSDLSSDLRDIYALIGRNESSLAPGPAGIDPIQKSLVALGKYEEAYLSDNGLSQHPLLKMHSAAAESLRLTSESFSANTLPKLSLFLKTSIDYPNGPILENINQNTVGLTLSMPIYEGGRSTSDAAEKQNLAVASDNRREQARIDIYRDWQKAKDQLKGLRDKREIHDDSVRESIERAKLVYGSYRAGRSSFLEVQSANLHALEAKVQATTNDVQILIQLAYLASISEEQ